jgi:hypothetical protein
MCEEKKENGLQELRARIEYLETSVGSRRGMGVAQVGEKYYSDASVVPGAKATAWRADEPSQIPPLFKTLCGLAPGAPLERAQSKSWGVVPEPLIQNVFWSDGGVEEYFRLQNQMVTLTFDDPTTGRPAAAANYTATVVASGRAKPDFGAANTMFFNLNLQNAQGGFLYEIRSPFAIGCHDNRFFGVGGRFYPDLYDVADKFHFFFTGNIRLVRC